jgi:tRNA-Thr(GGU) m(6)t(6)A37 methyltransferase TsaA
MSTLEFSPIGFVSSCYKEKFGIPRQPGLVNSAKSRLILNDVFTEESVRGLEGFSHIWLQFIFHETQEQGWKPMVRPPRLGGNQKVGVFASRSTFRPNPVGLSVVELEKIEIKQSTVVLLLRGCDLLDGTPILDIKPYLTYVDSIPDAKGGFATDKPENMAKVFFSKESELQCKQASVRLGENIKNLVTEILQYDPRPSYQRSCQNNDFKRERIYAMKLHDFDLKWQYCENNKIKVLGAIQNQ